MNSMSDIRVSPPVAQRSAGTARLSCWQRGGRTRLQRLYQEGSAKIRLPHVADGPLEAVLINTSGGLTGGDRLRWEVDIGPGAATVVTTQACEKIYRAASGQAEADVRLNVGAGGQLAWLPQETIVFDRAAFSRRLDVDLAKDAQALILEATLFGRRAMGESAELGLFRDRWRVVANGKLVHAEDFSIGPEIAARLRHAAVLGGAVALATVLVISPDAEARLDAVRTTIGEKGGASFWTVGQTGKLLARLYDTDGYSLRQRLVPLVRLLNGQAGLPKLWSL